MTSEADRRGGIRIEVTGRNGGGDPQTRVFTFGPNTLRLRLPLQVFERVTEVVLERVPYAELEQAADRSLREAHGERRG